MVNATTLPATPPPPTPAAPVEPAPGGWPSLDGDWLQPVLDVVKAGWFKWVIVAIVLVFVYRIVQGLRRARRLRRPVVIHPKLQKYAGGTGVGVNMLTPEHRLAAQQIVASSSTARITGFAIVQQVDALFVEDFLKPEEAVEGLKAIAAMKGANALINVRHERTDKGLHSASGDAVIVERPPGADDDDAAADKP